MSVKITASSGNMFADLGFGEQETERLRAGPDLIIAVRKLVEARRLPQAELARLTSADSAPGPAGRGGP